MGRMVLACLASVLVCGCAGDGSDIAACQPSVRTAPRGEDGTLLTADASSPTNLWAAGDGPGATSLVVRWDGAKWIRVRSPQGRYFHSLSVIAENDVWALARPDRPSLRHEVWRWNGAVWEKQERPEGSLLQFYAIEAITEDDVWVVGTNFEGNPTTSSFIAHWDGDRWSEAMNRWADLILEDVFAYAPAAVWAVGNRVDENLEVVEPAVLRWNGSEWRRMPAPRKLRPYDYVGLSNVAATGAEEIWSASGYLSDERLLRWDGTTWTSWTPPFEEIGSINAASGFLWAAGLTSDGQRVIARMSEDGWIRSALETSIGGDAAWAVVSLSDEVAVAVGREAVIHTGCIEE